MKDLRMPWWQILRACWKLPLPATQKAVLAAVASHVNDDGIARLLVGTLVDLTGLRRSTVQAALRALEERRPPVLERLKRPGRSSVYQINVAALPQLDLFAEEKRRSAAPVSTRPAGRPVHQAGHPSGGRGGPGAGHGCPPGGPITLSEPASNRRGPTGPSGRDSRLDDTLREVEIRNLLKMLGRPASLQRQPEETLDHWEARVRAAWKAEIAKDQRPPRAAGG